MQANPAPSASHATGVDPGPTPCRDRSQCHAIGVDSLGARPLACGQACRPGASRLRMPLTVAWQMDPIDRIDIRGDSTFALLLEAQRRGHAMFYYTPPNLSLLQGKLIAHGHALHVEDKAGSHFRVSDPRSVNLAELDVVLLRQDPPFDMAYITTTHL